MRDILLHTINEAGVLAGSILTTKSVKLQMEYLGTWKTKIMLPGVTFDISEEHLEAFLHIADVRIVISAMSKADIAARDVFLQVTMPCKCFMDISNI